MSGTDSIGKIDHIWDLMNELGECQYKLHTAIGQLFIYFSDNIVWDHPIDGAEFDVNNNNNNNYHNLFIAYIQLTAEYKRVTESIKKEMKELENQYSF